jgi:hypothetical protein
MSKHTTTIRDRLMQRGAANLREFGYPSANESNILADYIFRKMFRSMLEDDENKGAATAIEAARVALIAEIDAIKDDAP